MIHSNMRAGSCRKLAQGLCALPLLITATALAQPSQTAFRYVLNEHGQPKSRSKATIPPHLVSLADEAERELSKEKHLKDGALVYMVRSADGLIDVARTELHNLGPRSAGYRPGQIIEGEGNLYVGGHGKAVELRIRAPGYEEFRRKAILRNDQIILWDDIVLKRAVPGSGGTVKGSVWLEGDPSLEGIAISVNGEAQVFTDASGQFVLADVPAGSLRISTSQTGYIGLSTEVELGKKSTATCELRGYRLRAALVRWAYQPDGTRNFKGKIPGGTAIISPRELSRVSFAHDFGQVSARSDLHVFQKGSRLTIRAFDTRNPDQPGYISLNKSDFDNLRLAPTAGYSGVERELSPGLLLACKTYEGHFAKLEVIRVDESSSIESEEAPQSALPCTLADISISKTGPDSLAVIDFDHDQHVSEGTARACADLCRGVVNETGSFIVVERQSMIHLLGEQDFTATVRCDESRCLVDYGKKLRAQKLIHGRLSKAGNSYVLTIKLLDISTGAVVALKVQRVEGDADDLLSVVESQTCSLLQSAFVAR